MEKYLKSEVNRGFWKCCTWVVLQKTHGGPKPQGLIYLDHSLNHHSLICLRTFYNVSEQYKSDNMLIVSQLFLRENKDTTPCSTQSRGVWLKHHGLVLKICGIWQIPPFWRSLFVFKYILNCFFVIGFCLNSYQFCRNIQCWNGRFVLSFVLALKYIFFHQHWNISTTLVLFLHNFAATIYLVKMKQKFSALRFKTLANFVCLFMHKT